MVESLLLVCSICLDAFVASIAYGSNKIKIPVISSMVISIVGAVVLGVSLFLGSLIKDFLPGNLPITLSFSILMILGIYRLFESLFKGYIQKHITTEKSFSFKLFDFNFILQIYADETKADIDKSKVLSIKESLYLAIALSFDSLAVGFGSSLAGVNYIQTIILCFIVGLCATCIGSFIGKKLVEKTNIDLSWLSGVILMVLAITKII